MRITARLLLSINLLAITASSAIGSERSLSAMRTTFLQAEQYMAQDRDNDYFALSDTLKSYPLYPYLQYQWLAKHLDQSNAIQTFLRDYPDTRYAALLHTKWLTYLGKNQQWPRFVSHYTNTGNSELQCYFAQAQYHMGQQRLALDRAKQLWLSGKPQAAACDALLEWLKSSPDFSADLIWQRFQTAIERNNIQLAKQMLALLPKEHLGIAKTWLTLHDHPERVKAAAPWKRSYDKAGLLFVHAMRRWIAKDPVTALKVWDSQKQQFDIPAKLIAETEKHLGMELAFRKDARAYKRLSLFAADDPSAQEWRIRAALSQQNWQEVLTAIEALSDDLKHQDKWQYWKARALASIGQNQEASEIFTELAKQRSFYGFIAADRLQLPIALNHQAIQVSERDLHILKNNSAFLVVSELLAIERRTEATRQWLHAISELDAASLIVAAKLAQYWQWPSMAISTIAKAKHWDDMDLRFPLVFNESIRQHAEAKKLNPALVFALIRQESAFDEFAGSSAGAMGLMQLMPKTAQQIATELKERWKNNFNLTIPGTNINYGSYYFKKLLDRFDGHYPLAIAAYNAGANRVKYWLPKNQTLPADIWIETIPYKETRGYVSSVLMYALIYQQRLSKNELKIPDLLAEVRPG